MSKRTLFLIFSLAVTTFVLLVIAIYQPQAEETVSVTPTPQKPVAETILSFGEPSFTQASSASAVFNYSLPINISTGKNKITMVQLELQYDPTLLTEVTATSGSFLTNPTVFLNNIDETKGRVSYALGFDTEQAGIIGEGTVAKLLFSVRTTLPEKTAIIFLPKTMVTAEGINQSALKEDPIVGQFMFGPTIATPISSVSPSPSLTSTLSGGLN